MGKTEIHILLILSIHANSAHFRDFYDFWFSADRPFFAAITLCTLLSGIIDPYLFSMELT